MRRSLFAFGIMTLIFQYAQAQQVTKSTVTISKQPQAAQTVRFPEDEDVVKDALKSIIKQQDGKVKKSGGYIIGRNMKVAELSDQKLDLYFEVDGEGRRKNQTSIVTMAIKQPDGNFASDSSNPSLQERGTIYLAGIQQRVLVYKKDQEIAELQATLKKLNKSLANDRKNHQDNMEKKMKQMKEIETRLSALTGN